MINASCGEVYELIGPYVDDDLATESRHRVEAHLLTCKDCAWEAQSLRITRDRLREDIGVVTASDAFRTRVGALLRRNNPHLVAETSAEEQGQYALPMNL